MDRPSLDRVKSERTLKVKGVTHDLTDPQRLRFVLQFTRNMTPIEREFVPQAIMLKMRLPTEEHGPDTVPAITRLDARSKPSTGTTNPNDVVENLTPPQATLLGATPESQG